MTRKVGLALLVVFCLTCICIELMEAQITRPTAEQAPPVSGTGQHHAGGLSESVNPATGALSIRINTEVAPARGLTVPFAFGYDSNSAQHITGGLGLTDNSSYLGQGGWSYMVPTLSQIQGTFQTANGLIAGSANPVDPVVFVNCDFSDPACSIAAGPAGPVGCTAFFCAPSWTRQTTTTPTPCTFFDHFNFFDMNGNAHDLGITSQTGTHDCVSVPGAPATALIGGDNVALAQATTPDAGLVQVPSVTLVDSTGTLYSFPSAVSLQNGTAQGRVHSRVGDNPNLRSYIQFDMLPSYIEDRNGNITTFSDHGNGSFDVTDTLGRTAISTSGFGTTGNTVHIAGLANPYTVTWAPLSFSWQVGGRVYLPSAPATVPPTSCSGGGGTFNYNANGQIVPLQGITQIQLPNGQSYQFQYDPIYGLINKMIYPNGGYVRYVWGNNVSSSRELVPSTQPLTNAGATPLPCEIIHDTPVVVNRFVSFDGQHEVEEQDFSYGTTWAPWPDPLNIGMQDWTSKQTTLITKDTVTGASFKTVYGYIPRPNGAKPSKIEKTVGMYPTSPIEQTVQNFDANGNLLRTVNKNYLFTALFPALDETVTLDNGQTSTIHRCFLYQPCAPGQLPPPGQVLGNLLADSFEYDFGSGAPGPLIRHTHADYKMFKNPLFPDVYANPNGNPTTYLGVPQINFVYDGGGNRVAETDYGYDGNAVNGATVSGHDETTYGPTAAVTRANLTSATAKCFNTQTGAPCPDAISTYTYDETGQMLSKKDPLGNVTNFSYQDNFSDTSPATSTNGYLTKITLPPTNGVAHIETFSYSYSDGALSSSTDQNSQKTNYFYDDPFRRLTETDLPDGGQTKIQYNDLGASPNIVTTKRVSATNSSVSTAVMDGMGHVFQSQLNSDPAGIDFVDTTLDGLARPMNVSNPHRSTPLPTDGVTGTQYDALGRVKQITKQDGGVTTISYTGNCSLTVDEAGKRRRGCTDALGRLIEVDEPTPGVSETTSATTATATATISGGLQSKQLSNPATGTVTISGTDSIVSGTNAYDFGTVTVTVGSGSVSTSYGNSGSSPSSASSVASTLCSAINSTQGTSTLVRCSSSGAIMNLTAQTAGSAGNGIPVGVTAQTSFPQSNQSAFHLSSTSGTLSGGGTTVYDSATTTIMVSGYGSTARWSGSGTTLTSIASSLASAINNDPYAYVSATASGGVVSLTSKIIGLGGNLSLACSSGYDSSNFAQPSFGIACPSALSGGKEAGSLSVPMLTLYRYDPLNNLLQVIQQGGTTDQSQWRMRTFIYDSLSRLLVAKNPESGTISYAYDIAGNLVLKTSPQANQLSAMASTYITYCYDALNRILAKGYALSPNPPQQCSTTPPYLPNPAAVYTYDQGTNAIGHVTSLTDQPGSGTYTYDSMGRIASEHRTISGITENMSYTYNLDGSVATATYPSGAVITYTPNPDGRVGMVQDLANNINYVVGPGGPGTLASYGPDGALTAFVSGARASFPGITNSFSFNNRLQPINMAAVSPNPTGVNATATLTVSGTLQSTTSGATNPSAGAGNLTITGSERSVTIAGSRYCAAFDNHGRCVDWEFNPPTTTYDSGTVTITVNGHSDNGSYVSGSNPTSVATSLASTINADPSAFVNATALNGVLSLTARQTGAATNYSWSVSSSSSDAADFGTAGSFSSSTTSGGLTGGSNGNPGTTVYDSGTVAIALGSFNASVSYGQTSNSTASAVASALASAINLPLSPATATVNGTTLNLVWKTAGTVTTVVNPITTTHDQSTVFQSPSFTSPATSFSGGSNETVFSLNYDFHVGNGDNGNVWGITNNKDTTRSQTFTYDVLNRLISAQNAGTDCSVPVLQGKTKFWGNSYSYDAWGNLLQKTVTKCTAEHLLATPDVQNRIHVSAPDYGYDAAGNMTSDTTDGVTAVYDAENRITGANGFTYIYDAGGRRVEKTNGSSGTLYWYMTPGIVGESDLSGNLQSEYVFFDGERVARKDFPSNAVSYYFSDHLKTASVVTDWLGNIKSESDFYPWGGELQFVNNDTNHYKFTGKERDNETGLDYYGARYYGSALGRFVTPDWSAKPVPVPYVELGDPQSLNQYAYVRNNPLSKNDPDGHCDAPAGLTPGGVGVCVASYIQTKWFKTPGRGDGRGPNPHGGTSRVESRILVDPKQHTATQTYDHVGRSGIGGQDVGLKGKGGSTVSSTQSDKEGNTYFQVSQHGESAMKSLTFGLVIDGTIDNHLNLAVTPDGKVGVDPGSTARDFPSLEVYSYTMDEKGNVTSTLILDKREASPNDKNGDLGHPEKTIKDEVPK